MSFSAYRVCLRNQGRYSEYSGSGNLYVHPEEIPALPAAKENERLWKKMSEFPFDQLMLSLSPFWFNHKQSLPFQRQWVSPRAAERKPVSAGLRTAWGTASLVLLKGCEVTRMKLAGGQRTWALAVSLVWSSVLRTHIPGRWQHVLIKCLLKFRLLEHCFPPCLLGW